MTRLKILGQNIKRYREQKNFSQNQLAELVNLSREHIGSVETGNDFLSLRKLFEIADALNIPVKKLIDFD